MNNRQPFRLIPIIASILVLTIGCASTPASRISKKQALFDSYSIEVQSNLRQGRVDVGYNEDMVRMALGDPDETSVEIREDGETVMWGYTRSRPGISVGLGGGSFGGSTAVGGGVGMGSAPRRDYTAIIEFREAKVTTACYFDD